MCQNDAVINPGMLWGVLCLPTLLLQIATSQNVNNKLNVSKSWIIASRHSIATPVALDRYQSWLRGDQPVVQASPVTPRKTAMTAELQQQQQPMSPMSPMSPGRTTFYRPMSERMLDKSAERRLSEVESDKPSGVITSSLSVW